MIECVRKTEPKPNGKIRSHIFSNGLRLIYEPPYTNIPITTIYAYCNVGSVNESNNLRGASHFIEHCIFKGTKKLTNLEIFNNYDNAGASLNAFTERRVTYYFVKMDAKNTEICIQTLGDMMLYSTFPSSEFVKEEKVVIEENLIATDNAEITISDLYNSIMYAGSSYEHPIDDISFHKRPFCRKDVIDYYHKFYRPNQIVLSIVSTLSFQKIVKMIEHSPFSKYKPLSMPIPDKYAIQFCSPRPQSGIIYKVLKKSNIETLHLTISFRTCSFFSHDKYIFELLQHIMSETFGNMLSVLLRENNGLTYTSSTINQNIETTGDFTIYAQLNKTKLLRNGIHNLGVLPLIISLLNDLVQHGVPNKTFKTAKTNMRGQMMLDTEKSNIQASRNGLEWLLRSKIDAVIPYQDLYESTIAPITQKDLHHVIRHYFKKSSMVVCLVGDKFPSMKLIEHECEKFIPL